MLSFSDIPFQFKNESNRTLKVIHLVKIKSSIVDFNLQVDVKLLVSISTM